MTRKHRIVAGMFLTLACSAGSASASQLSPCLRVLTYTDGRFGQEPIRVVNFCAKILNDQQEAAVHEHMSIASILKYRSIPAFAASGPAWKFEYMADKPWTIDETRYHESHAIIFGTWWNDDPLMRSWGQGLLDFVFGSVSSWRAITNETRDGKDKYPGGIRCCRVDAATHLGRASHYGQLQHLHFMTTLKRPASTREQRVQATTEEALKWLGFAYQVATRELDAEAPLTPHMMDVLSLPSIADNFCVSDPANLKVRTLFSRLGQQIEYRNRIVPDVALGSMLHMLQDSFSPSHTCRIEQSNGAGSIALLADVENYGEQEEHAHALLDGVPAWLREYAATGRHVYENDPIVVGAWLLSAVDRQLPWPLVETHLRDTIFAAYRSGAAVSNNMCMGRDVSLLAPVPGEGLPPETGVPAAPAAPRENFESRSNTYSEM